MLHVRREIKETVHLQNLNCLASLRTKVIPSPVSLEAFQRRKKADAPFEG